MTATPIRGLWVVYIKSITSLMLQNKLHMIFDARFTVALRSAIQTIVAIFN